MQSATSRAISLAQRSLVASVVFISPRIPACRLPEPIKTGQHAQRLCWGWAEGGTYALKLQLTLLSQERGKHANLFRRRSSRSARRWARMAFRSLRCSSSGKLQERDEFRAASATADGSPEPWVYVIGNGLLLLPSIRHPSQGPGGPFCSVCAPTPNTKTPKRIYARFLLLLFYWCASSSCHQISPPAAVRDKLQNRSGATHLNERCYQLQSV